MVGKVISGEFSFQWAFSVSAHLFGTTRSKTLAASAPPSRRISQTSKSRPKSRVTEAASPSRRLRSYLLESLENLYKRKPSYVICEVGCYKAPNEKEHVEM